MAPVFKKITLLLTLVGISFNGISQEFQSKDFQFPLAKTIKPREVKDDFLIRIYNLEKPNPGGESYKSFIQQQKIEQRKLHPLKKEGMQNYKTQSASSPEVLFGKYAYRRTFSGRVQDIMGGIPSDNTFAANKKNQFIIGINSLVWGWDMEKDTFLLDNQVLSLTSFAPGGNTDHFDPKLIFDPVKDRFILVFLEDRTPTDSRIVVAFSTTDNPNDPWNAYYLPGNPLNNNRWTDYPAISLTDKGLFVTGNLIVPNEPWQTGFDGSVIWHVSTEDGYAGNASIQTRLYTGIKYNGKYIRNLHCVRGAEGYADEAFFLSNRNFALENDSIFILQVKSSLDQPEDLAIMMRKSDTKYGVPPNGRQADTDLQDPTSGLQTNDGRVLGGILKDHTIQFVSVTVNPPTGFAAIYHGKVEDVYGNPIVTANILGDQVMDLGYPNIVFSGNEACDQEVMIGLDYTSPTDFCGMGVIYMDNEGNYSDLIRLRDGDNISDNITGGYERWGDYFGIQRVYEDPGKVFVSGFFGLISKGNGTYTAKLASPDTNKFVANMILAGSPGLCSGEAKVEVSGGLAPYSYLWQDGSMESSFSGICFGDSLYVKVSDSRGCEKTFSKVYDIPEIPGDRPVFPNPAEDEVSVQFTLDKEERIKAHLTDLNGRIYFNIENRLVKKGRNQFTFNTSTLKSGMYFLTFFHENGDVIFTEKVMVK